MDHTQGQVSAPGRRQHPLSLGVRKAVCLLGAGSSSNAALRGGGPSSGRTLWGWWGEFQSWLGAGAEFPGAHELQRSRTRTAHTVGVLWEGQEKRNEELPRRKGPQTGP